MLTRLKVNGFKNLIDLDVSFGPFTCIAGGNGVGKSNVFDAIRFLSALASTQRIDQAATLVRGDLGDVRDLFTRTPSGVLDEMQFEVEMIVPTGVEDSFFAPGMYGRAIKPKGTFLRYQITLRWVGDDQPTAPIQMITERLSYADPTGSRARELLGFAVSDAWIESAVIQDNSLPDPVFIHASLTLEPPETGVLVPDAVASPGGLFYSLLSTVTDRNNDTALMAQHEMRSWAAFDLEPRAMRETMKVVGNDGRLQPDGRNLTGALARLKQRSQDGSWMRYAQGLINHLLSLGSAFRRIDVETGGTFIQAFVAQADGTQINIDLLSDGMLRYLALALIGVDPDGAAVVCLEEPENGIHPGRVPALLALLRNIAVDTDFAVDVDNPLRQVIITSHSPAVVQQTASDDLLLAQTVFRSRGGQHAVRALMLSPLIDTWRTHAPLLHQGSGIGSLVSFLVQRDPHEEDDLPGRIIDREDVRTLTSVVDTRA